MSRVYNFSPGPAVLPLKVLEEAQRDLLCIPGVGVSALEVSHRSSWFTAVLEETEANLRKLLQLSEDYHVLFLQGGSRLQFSMVPMNLLGEGSRSADYIVTGSWGKMAFEEALREGTARQAFNGKSENFSRLPRTEELQLDPRATYAHFTSNETIQGVQFLQEPETAKVPLICDASSDFMCRPLDIQRYGMIYACAQKNAGPAGVTIVILREDLLQKCHEDLPTMLAFKPHIQEKSRLNTPPVFAIYLVMLITRWLMNDIGGLEAMLTLNRKKAKLLYDILDKYPDFYQGHAHKESRSLMNVTFRLPNDAIQEAFVSQAKSRKLHDLKGHRSVGGIRASIYNAMPIEGVEALRNFMEDFYQQQVGK